MSYLRDPETLRASLPFCVWSERTTANHFLRGSGAGRHDGRGNSINSSSTVSRPTSHQTRKEEAATYIDTTRQNFTIIIGLQYIPTTQESLGTLQRGRKEGRIEGSEKSSRFLYPFSDLRHILQNLFSIIIIINVDISENINQFTYHIYQDHLSIYYHG